MSRRTRLGVFAVGAGGIATLFVLAVLELAPFGGSAHPYRDAAVAAAVRHATANVVSSVNFDQRGLDTLGEESIFMASVLAVATLLRPARGETRRAPVGGGRVLDATMLGGWVLLTLSVLLGFDVIAHGSVTPGGGFQGGVVLGTAIHLLYVAGTYKTLERIRPTGAFEWGEAIGTGAFVSLGVAGAMAAGAFLDNLLPKGTFGTLFSSGTVELLNGAVGIEVASGVIVLIARFLEQLIVLRADDGVNRDANTAAPQT